MRNSRLALVLVVAPLWCADHARAGVKRELPLPYVVDQCKFAVAAKIETVNAKRGFLILVRTGDLKGRSRFDRFKHNLSTGDRRHAEEILSTVKPGDPAVLFFTDDSSPGIACFTHLNGKWYQTHGRNAEDPERVWWNFIHAEPGMQLCFHGSSGCLATAVKNLVAGKEVEITKLSALREGKPIQVKVTLSKPPVPAPANGGR